MLRPDGRAEVEEIAASVRERVRVWRPEFEIAIEHLACRIWRQRRAYADISENGLVRDGQPAPMLRDLAKLEGQIRRDLDAFGLTPRSAAALGLSVAARDRTLSLIELHAAAAARRGPSVELLARYGSDPVGFSRRRVAPDIEPSRDLDQTSTIKRRMVSLTSGGTSSIP